MDQQVRIYADGIFDLFHFGHARMLEQAKKTFPNVYLIVGVNTDMDTLRYKGITVMSQKERCECVRHCKWVDEVIEDAPWVITEEFLNTHNIDFVAHDGDPYPLSTQVSSLASGLSDIYAIPKSLGRFLSTQRTDGISTSELIERIIINVQSYEDRNIARGIHTKIET